MSCWSWNNSDQWISLRAQIQRSTGELRGPKAGKEEAGSLFGGEAKAEGSKRSSVCHGYNARRVLESCLLDIPTCPPSSQFYHGTELRMHMSEETVGPAFNKLHHTGSSSEALHSKRAWGGCLLWRHRKICPSGVGGGLLQSGKFG